MKTVVDCAFASMADYIEQLPAKIKSGEGEIVYDKRNSVVRFRHHGYALMVKRFKPVNLIQQVVYTFFRKSKAERAYLFAKEFTTRGIATPQRVAYMEQKKLGLFSVGYFVSTEAEGTECHLLLREVQDFSHELADAVIALVVLIHSRGILHGDLNLSNFLCRQDENGYHFTIIDINRSVFLEDWPTDEQCLKNLVRLTHRRDLYEYLVGRYAEMRGWDVQETVRKARLLLHRFEHRRIRL